MKDHKIVILIPAYNEAKTIDRIITEARKSFPSADIVVINDGSTDSTAEIAEKSGVFVISLPYNLGIGGAIQTGYIFAKEMGYKMAVRVDADAQHDPNDIIKIVTPILEGKSDLVIGSRFIGNKHYRSPLARRIGMVILSSFISLIIRQRVTDTTSGFQAVNEEVIKFYANDYPHDYPEPEALVVLHRAGYRIQEVPVLMRQRAGGRSSIDPFSSLYYMIKVLLAILIGLLRKSSKERR